MQTLVSFDQLTDCDLVVGAVYQGGGKGNASDDPLARLLPCGNQGGFRISGSRKDHQYRMAVLYTDGTNPDWPDQLDKETGLLTYFGDNRRTGKELHDTSRGGNELLRFAFDAVHSHPAQRDVVPPFFVFEKANPGPGRDVEFLGLAVPGSNDVAAATDLVAVWRTTAGKRFQNYRATFTVLDAPVITRGWIDELASGVALGPACPAEFRQWREQGHYQPLEAPRTIEYRTQAEQEPQSVADKALLAEVYAYFKDDPYRFEACAIEIWKMLAKESVTTITPTRRSADGGRDAYGVYSIGPASDRVHLDFSLEAKCKQPGSGCGVKDTSRLISRLRHRQFGVFVTTSFVGPQPYREIRDDGHPFVIIAGRDIVDILREHGVSTPGDVSAWLQATFPDATT